MDKHCTGLIQYDHRLPIHVAEEIVEIDKNVSAKFEQYVHEIIISKNKFVKMVLVSL